MSQQLIAGIARSAMLVSLNIGLYTGRKQDKRTRDEVTAAKGARSASAASVYKNLFSSCPELEAITKYASKVRVEHYALTLPWADDGPRLLPTKAYLDYTAKANTWRQHFEFLVDAFLDKYDTLVAAAAFQLGTLFDRDEYPSREQVARRFYFDVRYTPLPTAGDFRLDIESEVQQDLANKYEERLAAQLETAQRDAWQRLYDTLSHMQERLTLTEDGKRKVFHSTMIENAHELCATLTRLNVTNDPKLEAARAQLERAIAGVDPAELRKEEGERLTVLAKVNATLDAFDWGSDDE